MFKDGSAWDGAQLLRREIGPNVEVMEISTSPHATKLVEGNREVKEKKQFSGSLIMPMLIRLAELRLATR